MNTQKRTRQIALVLTGAAAVGCSPNSQPKLGDTVYRDGYSSLSDCRQDWSDDDCQDSRYIGGGSGGYRFYGPYRSTPMRARALPFGAATLSEQVDAENRSRISSSFRARSMGFGERVTRGGFGEGGGGEGGGE